MWCVTPQNKLLSLNLPFYWFKRMQDVSVVQNSSEAATILETEYQRTADEVVAFTEFCRRVADVEVSSLQPDGGSQLTVPVQAVRKRMQPSGCDRIQQAYRDTLLAMSHYKDEYDESLREHMAHELGTAIADTIHTESRLTQPIKQTTLEASQQAATKREALLSQLEAERNALQTARSTLTEIATDLRTYNARPLQAYTFPDLREIYTFLDDAEAQCEQVATQRQTALHEDDRTGPHRFELGDLQTYLYQEMDMTYPILADIATCCRYLEQARSRIERALATTA